MQFLRQFNLLENIFWGVQVQGVKNAPLEKILARTLGDRTDKSRVLGSHSYKRTQFTPTAHFWVLWPLDHLTVAKGQETQSRDFNLDFFYKRCLIVKKVQGSKIPMAFNPC
jgi:hypothetical protein